MIFVHHVHFCKFHKIVLPGNMTEKGEGLKRALDVLYPNKRWIILLQETGDLPWSGRYRSQWNKLETNNLCGYDLIIFQDDKKECEDEIFIKGASQQLIIASVKDSFSLDNIEERVIKQSEAFNLNTDLVVTFRNGIGLLSESSKLGCVEYIKVDGIHVIYSGQPKYVRIDVG